MKKLFFHLISGVMILCLFSFPCFAQTGYVSDMLLLNFRQGPGNSHPVIKTLKSNTPVSILGEQNGFYKAELQSKEIGWIDKNFIVFDLPKTQIIDQLKLENKRLENKISQLEAAHQELKTNTKAVDAAKATDVNKPKKTGIQSDPPANIKKLLNENKLLQKENITLLKALETLKENNKTLFKTSMIKWFLAGVGVLLLGWLIGKSVSSKKRQSSSSLLS